MVGYLRIWNLTIPEYHWIEESSEDCNVGILWFCDTLLDSAVCIPRWFWICGTKSFDGKCISRRSHCRHQGMSWLTCCFPAALNNEASKTPLIIDICWFSRLLDSAKMLRSRILFCDMLKCWCLFKFQRIPFRTLRTLQLHQARWLLNLFLDHWGLGLVAFYWQKKMKKWGILGKVTLGAGSQTSLIRLLVPNPSCRRIAWST